MIPYGRQCIEEDDIEAVKHVLESDFLTQGPCVPQFERALCEYTGANYGTAVNSATSALHLACLALGVTSNSLVWTSPISFVASANCARYCGADVDFVDIEYDTHNIDMATLSAKLKHAKESGRRLPDVVIAVHMAGLSCDMKTLKSLSLEYQFKIIEDASHGIGGEYDNRKIGCCAYSDICVFSFHPVKIVTTGEGGAALCNDKKLHDQLQRLRSHGITKDPNELSVDDPWYYEQLELGFNYRMTDLQSALGLSQLKKIDGFIDRRRRIAAHYYEAFQGADLTLPNVGNAIGSSWHLYIIKLPRESECRREVFERLRDQGIGVNVHYIPIYKQPYYQALGFTEQYCSVAEQYYKNCITLPIYPSMSEKEVALVIDRVLESLH